MPKFIDLTSQTFGWLTVLYRTYRVGDKRTYWMCECECGNETTVRGDGLKSGHTQSCGCYNIECSIERTTTAKGMYKTPTWNTYHSMKMRCYNSNFKKFHLYGGKGITMCDRWLESFNNFIDDMGERPPHTTIDRIDGDKGYYKENCRWATIEEQNNNLSTNIYIDVYGELILLSTFRETYYPTLTQQQMRDRYYYAKRKGKHIFDVYPIRTSHTP